MSTFFICPHCETKVPTGARACPECGSDEQTGWAAGSFSDSAAERRRGFAGPGWLKPVALGLLVLVVLGTASTMRRPAAIGLALLLLIVVVGYQALNRRPTLNLGLGRERELYARLLNKAHGDHALAERLIAYERGRTPNLARQQLIQSAIYRWDRDNR
jgi:hypothetical protein